jgi:hypothetical protein
MKSLDQKIIDAKKELEDCRREVSALEDEHYKKYEEPRLKKMIGKCYKTTNNYSCPESPEDYWFLYTKIIKVEDKHLIANRFQMDKYNRVEFFISEYVYENILGEEIDEKEFTKEFKKVINFVQSEIENK